MLRRNFLTTFAAALVAAAVPNAVTRAASAAKPERVRFDKIRCPRFAQDAKSKFVQEPVPTITKEEHAELVSEREQLQDNLVYTFKVIDKAWAYLLRNYPRIAARAVLTLQAVDQARDAVTGRFDFNIDGQGYYAFMHYMQGEILVDMLYIANYEDANKYVSSKPTIDLEMQLLAEEQLQHVFSVVLGTSGKPNRNGDVFSGSVEMRAGEGVQLTHLPDGAIRVSFCTHQLDQEKLRESIRGIRSPFKIYDEIAMPSQEDLHHIMSVKAFGENLDFACISAK